jgi:predicted DNA binding protein
MQVQQAAGLPADVLATLRSAGATCLESSLHRASDENGLTVLTDLQTDPDHHESLRSLAATHDLRMLVNVPLVADGVVHGVLTVGVRDDDTFSDREQSVLQELGGLVGSAIDAIQTKKLLHASGYQELTMAAAVRDAPLVAFQDRLECRLTLDSVVPVESGRYLLYLAVEETTPEAVAAAADGIDGIQTARFVESDRRPLVELSVDGETAVGALLDAGGRLRGLTAEDSIGEFVVQVPLDTDIRSYLDRVEQHGIDMGLLAKHEVEGPVRVSVGTTTDGLTARQRTVLEAAYRAGYFDWPRRRTTGEELAASLDISSSTLHQHLRVATRKALDEYFEVHAGETL